MRKSFISILVLVNSRELRSRASSQTSVAYRRIGKHLARINARIVSSEAERPTLLRIIFFTLKALPATNLADNWSLLLIIGCIGTSCLAAVLGFVSFMPGGAGVRELVLMLSLEPLIGGPMALAVAIWYRLVTLGAELFLAAIAALFPPKPPQKGLSATPAVPNDDKVD